MLDDNSSQCYRLITRMVAKAKIKRLRDALHNLSGVVCLRDPLSVAVEADITPPQMHTILALGRGDMSMTALGRRLNAAGPTITGIIDRLERLGLVERQRNDADRRVVRLNLTGKGRELYERFGRAIEQHLDLLLGLLDSNDQEGLVAIMERLSARAVELAAEKETDHAS